MTYFDNPKNSADSIVSRLVEDSYLVAKCTGDTMAKQLQALFTLAVGLGLSFAATWKLSLVVLSTFPFTIVAAIIQMNAFAGLRYSTVQYSAIASMLPYFSA